MKPLEHRGWFIYFTFGVAVVAMFFLWRGVDLQLTLRNSSNGNGNAYFAAPTQRNATLLRQAGFVSLS